LKNENTYNSSEISLENDHFIWLTLLPVTQSTPQTPHAARIPPNLLTLLARVLGIQDNLPCS